jgi:hypothetical protein
MRGETGDDAGQHAQREVREEKNGGEGGRSEGDPADDARHFAPMTAAEGLGVMPP